MKTGARTSGYCEQNDWSYGQENISWKNEKVERTRDDNEGKSGGVAVLMDQWGWKKLCSKSKMSNFRGRAIIGANNRNGND